MRLTSASNANSTRAEELELSAGGRKYDDVAQVSKPAVSRISKSASAMTKDGLPTGKSAIQQVCKPALQNTSPNLRPGLSHEPACLSPSPLNGERAGLRGEA